MVRPHFGPPHPKSRPYRDNNGMGSSSDSNYRSRREDHGFHGKPPPVHWKESRGRGRPPMGRRGPFEGDPRESRFNNWRSSNEDSYHTYSSKTEPPHQRRPSPSRSNRSPHGQHHSRSPAHRGPPFHRYSPGHRSPSPRHFHSHPDERRPGPPPPFRGSFRGTFRGKRHPGFSHPEPRSRDPPANYSPRERPYEPSHGKRWNGAGAFSHSHNEKSPREFHGRGPERYRSNAGAPAGWSTEQDPRRQRGPMERQHSRDRAQDPHPHPPPYRPPSWKGGPPHSPSRERRMMDPRKRRISDVHHHPSDYVMEHDEPKYPRRERPPPLNMPRPLGVRPFGSRPFGTRPFGSRPFGPRPFGARPFGVRPLSLRDRSFLIKSRQMRTESLMKLRLPPSVRARASFSSVLALRKKRFESGAAPLRKQDSREEKSKQSPAKSEGNSSHSSTSSHSAKEQVESRRSVNSHRSSPPKKDDLVVLSHWDSSKDHSPPRDHNPETERSSGAESASTSQTKPHFTRSFENRNRAYVDRRPDFGGDGFFRKPFRGVSRRPGPPVDRFMSNNFQRPAFRKSLSIVSKYRNMRVMRGRGSYSRGSYSRGSYSRGPEQRW